MCQWLKNSIDSKKKSVTVAYFAVKNRKNLLTLAIYYMFMYIRVNQKKKLIYISSLGTLINGFLGTSTKISLSMRP